MKKKEEIKNGMFSRKWWNTIKIKEEIYNIELCLAFYYYKCVFFDDFVAKANKTGYRSLKI